MTPEDDHIRYVTLREVDIRFDAVDDRFDSTNAWRETLESLQRGYLPRNEFIEFNVRHDLVHGQLSVRIDETNKRVDGTQQWIWIGVGIAIAIQFLVGAMLLYSHGIK
jgi:hypothetical protein